MKAVFFAWAYSGSKPVYLDYRIDENSFTGGWVPLEEGCPPAVAKGYWKARKISNTMEDTRGANKLFIRLTRCQARKMLREKGFDYLELPK